MTIAVDFTSPLAGLRAETEGGAQTSPSGCAAGHRKTGGRSPSATRRRPRPLPGCGSLIPAYNIAVVCSNYHNVLGICQDRKQEASARLPRFALDALCTRRSTESTEAGPRAATSENRRQGQGSKSSECNASSRGGPASSTTRKTPTTPRAKLARLRRPSPPPAGSDPTSHALQGARPPEPRPPLAHVITCHTYPRGSLHRASLPTALFSSFLTPAPCLCSAPSTMPRPSTSSTALDDRSDSPSCHPCPHASNSTRFAGLPRCS